MGYISVVGSQGTEYFHVGSSASKLFPRRLPMKWNIAMRAHSICEIEEYFPRKHIRPMKSVLAYGWNVLLAPHQILESVHILGWSIPHRLPTWQCCLPECSSAMMLSTWNVQGIFHWQLTVPCQLTGNSFECNIIWKMEFIHVAWMKHIYPG